MSCVLRVAGSKSAVRKFAARTSLPVCRVFIAGEPIWPGSNRLTRVTGLNISVSDAPGSDLPAQVKETLVFFRKHARELRRISAAFPRSSPELDFSIWVTAPPETYTHSYRLPPQLLKLAGAYGFTARLSLYPTDIAAV
jgi:hypothetical protein